jgi:23S rRNA pseudouridine1911/1915/1917 synthase
MKAPEIVYEDNHLIVCIKPFNVPSQADRSGDDDMLSIVREYIRKTCDKPGNVYAGLVHRLDRPAGGLMVFARTSKAAARLAASMRAGTFIKRYMVRTERAPVPPEGEWTDELIKGEGNNVRVAVPGEAGGKRAVLRYRVVGPDSDETALVEVDLITGRPHQIRVQFAHRGFPVVGDARYSKGGTQLRLWSAHLGFPHPTKQEEIAFDAPTPAGF